MRVRKRNWTEKELTANPYILGEGAAHKGRWQAYFGNANPLHLEIGCGMGNFITESALLNRQINYIAVEREKEVLVSGARKIREHTEATGEHIQIVFIKADVANITEYFDKNEIDRVYINFCDPWPNKKKWAKRRLTHRNFLELYKNFLVDQGEIHFKTDNRQLFEFSLCEMSQNGWVFRDVSLDLHQSGYEDNIMTEYEKKFSQKGFPIYRLEAALRKSL